MFSPEFKVTGNCTSIRALISSHPPTPSNSSGAPPSTLYMSPHLPFMRHTYLFPTTSSTVSSFSWPISSGSSSSSFSRSDNTWRLLHWPTWKMIVGQPAMVQNYLQLYRNKQHTRGTPTLYLLAIVLQERYTMYVFSAHPTANRWSPIAHTCYTHTWTVSGSCSNVYLHYSSSIYMYTYSITGNTEILKGTTLC